MKKELKNVKLYPSIHKMKNNRKHYGNVDFNKTPFYIQEKIDGSNISILRLNKSLHVFSRNTNITNNLTNIAGISVFIKDNEKALLKFLRKGEVLNGEWLASGRVKYVGTLSDLDFNGRFVLFNLGKLTKLTIKELNGNLTDGEKLSIKEAGDRDDRKIKFYSNPYTLKRFNKNKLTSTLKNTLDNLDSPQFRLHKLEKEWEVYDFKTNELLGSTLDKSFEEYLKNHPVFSKSKLFPVAESIEGVVFKTNDNSIILKYVLSTFSKQVKSLKNKSFTELTDSERQWVQEMFYHEGRDHKFLQYISEVSQVFSAKSPDEIKDMVHTNTLLLGNIFSHINWLIDDIWKEHVFGDNDKYKNKEFIRAVKKILIQLEKVELT